MHYTNRILAFQRVQEASDEALENFLANDPDTFREIFDAIVVLESNEKPVLRDITLIVNLLMASVI